MKKINNLFIAITAIICFESCEKELSHVPSIPTYFSIENYAIITDTVVQLYAYGSETEDNSSIYYHYYIGTSKDSFERVDGIYRKPINIDSIDRVTAKVHLLPYTQYYWYVRTSTEKDGGYGEPSEIYTFYCVPNIEVKIDNGDDKWASVLRFKNLPTDKIKGGTAVITPDHSGYELDAITLSEGQDSCYLELSQEKACVHGYDDEHGIVYQPVIYTFDVELIFRIGDKDISSHVSAENIVLNKKLFVCDSEFNVYRVVKIGNQTWLADDFRATSYIDVKGNRVQLKEGKDYFVSTLESGAKGILYDTEIMGNDNIFGQIKGYRLFDTNDWNELLDYYNPKGNNNLTYEENCNIMDCLISSYDWKENNSPEYIRLFNSKPFGIIGYHSNGWNNENGWDKKYENVAEYQGSYAISYNDGYYVEGKYNVYTEYIRWTYSEYRRCTSARHIKK